MELAVQASIKTSFHYKSGQKATAGGGEHRRKRTLSLRRGAEAVHVRQD